MTGPAALLVAPNSYVLRNWLASGLADGIAEQLGLTPIVVSHFDDGDFAGLSGRRYHNHSVGLSRVRGKELPAGYPEWLYAEYYLRLRTAAAELPFGGGQLLTLSRTRDAFALAARFAATVAPRSSRRRRIIREWLDRADPRLPYYESMIRTASPRCVVVGTPGIFFLDQLMIIAARRVGVPTYCIVNSWDNLVSRGPMVRRPDRLMVWNGCMRAQAIAVHAYPADRIDVVGSLQFSQYADPVTPAERRSVRRRAGLGPDEPYFLYLGATSLVQYEAEDLSALMRALDESEFAGTSVVVRPHPQFGPEAYGRVRHPDLKFDQPPVFSAKGGQGLAFDVREMRAMATLLSDAEVVFASAGTTALLEAAIFDKPTIQLRWFDRVARANETEVRSMRDVQRFIHIRDFDATGARAFSDDPSTLAAVIRAMRDHPGAWSQRRQEAVRRLVTPPVGDAPARILEVLGRELGIVGRDASEARVGV